MIMFLSSLFFLGLQVVAAHPIDQFKGHWLGPCTENGKPLVKMDLLIQNSLEKNRLEYVITYLPPSGNIIKRKYSLTFQDQNRSQVILDEGNQILFEEMIQENVMFGLLKNGQTLVHSRFEVKSKTMQVHMTAFSERSQHQTETQDYRPQSLQNCLLVKQ